MAQADGRAGPARRNIIRDWEGELLPLDRDLIELLAARAPAPIDWPHLRERALRPASADGLIERVLAAARGASFREADG
jgi:hypothetical protein